MNRFELRQVSMSSEVVHLEPSKWRGVDADADDDGGDALPGRIIPPSQHG